MWEWSIRKNKGKPDKSLISAYGDLIKQDCFPPILSTAEIRNLVPDSPKILDMRSIIEKKINEFGLKNITLIEKSYDPQTWQEMVQYFAEYKVARIAFLKLLAYSCKEECQEIGLKKADLNLMKQGLAPENFNTHIKIPFDFGGSIDFSNLSLIKSHPTHDHIHALIDMQIERGFLIDNKKIFIPYFEGKIYHG